MLWPPDNYEEDVKRREYIKLVRDTSWYSAFTSRVTALLAITSVIISSLTAYQDFESKKDDHIFKCFDLETSAEQEAQKLISSKANPDQIWQEINVTKSQSPDKAAVLEQDIFMEIHGDQKSTLSTDLFNDLSGEETKGLLKCPFNFLVPPSNDMKPSNAKA